MRPTSASNFEELDVQKKEVLNQMGQICESVSPTKPQRNSVFEYKNTTADKHTTNLQIIQSNSQKIQVGIP